MFHPKTLAQKAMLVRLTTHKPRLTVRNPNVEINAQRANGDRRVKARTALFTADTRNPINMVLAAWAAPYQTHRKLTLGGEDRGAKLLPVVVYEEYRDAMRQLRAEAEHTQRLHIPDQQSYACLVDLDVDFANSAATTPAERTASAADYPTFEEFTSSLGVSIQFSPLPDKQHFLFDIDEEDRNSLDKLLEDAANGARQDLVERLRVPMRVILDALQRRSEHEALDEATREARGIKKAPTFRDSAVDNIKEAADLVRKLSMGDPDIDALADQVTAIATAVPADMMRESPVIRDQVINKMKAIEDKMAAFFPTNNEE